MTTTLDYALFALNAYFREDENQGPVPPGWRIIDTFRPEESWTDFSAVAYRRTGTDEVVIAYSGSDSSYIDPTKDWGIANLLAATGAYSPQVQQAIEFYADVRAALTAQGMSPEMPITLTGHSLGGGLASIVATFFDQPAKVFDTAPFEYSVHRQAGLLPRIPPAMLSIASVRAYFSLYGIHQFVNGNRPVSAAFAQYVQAQNIFTGFNDQFVLREDNVESWFLAGDGLALARSLLPTIEGDTNDPLPIPSNGLSGKQLHSMALLTATQLSPSFNNAVSVMLTCPPISVPAEG